MELSSYHVGVVASRFIPSILAHDLVDGLHLLLYPVTLGSGKRVFPEGVHARFDLRDITRYPSGVVDRRTRDDLSTERTMPRTPTVSRPSKPKKKTAAAKRPVRTKLGARADYGKPIEGMLARQPPHLRAIAEELRGMIEVVAPEAESSLKWGMPCFMIGNGGRVDRRAQSAREPGPVGPKGTYPGPKGLLSGEGKIGVHLRLTSAAEIPRSAVRGWLRTAAEHARKE